MSNFLKHDSGEGRVEAAFCFVDLSGYTALTEAHGDDKAADLAVCFAELVKGSLGPGGRLIKMAGDGALVREPNAKEALHFIGRLFEKADEERNFPLMRAGLHHGEAVEREGEIFGATINLTARIAAEAAGGQVLATKGLTQAAQELGLAVTSLGPFHLHNVRDPVELFAIDLAESAFNTAIDPVCRMKIEKKAATRHLRVKQTDYWFCSPQCAADFTQNPGAYIRMRKKERQ